MHKPLSNSLLWAHFPVAWTHQQFIQQVLLLLRMLEQSVISSTRVMLPSQAVQTRSSTATKTTTHRPSVSLNYMDKELVRSFVVSYPTHVECGSHFHRLCTIQ